MRLDNFDLHFPSDIHHEGDICSPPGTQFSGTTPRTAEHPLEGGAEFCLSLWPLFTWQLPKEDVFYGSRTQFIHWHRISFSWQLLILSLGILCQPVLLITTQEVISFYLSPYLKILTLNEFCKGDDVSNAYCVDFHLK